MNKEKYSFTKELINFYVSFFKGVSESIKILSDIQKRYKEEYRELKEMQINPTKIYELTEKLSAEDKRLILDLLLRANLLQAKMMKIFDLTSKQQKELAKEIERYLEDFEKFIGDKIDRK